MTIDVHQHYFGEDLLADLNELLVARAGEEAAIGQFYGSDEIGLSTAGPPDRLANMDEWGLDTAVLSFPSPGSFINKEHLSDPDFAAAFCRTVNDHLAGLRDRHPDRLWGFANVPLVDSDGAIAELDRALDELHLQGIVLDSNIFGRSLVEDQFRPFFEHANDRGVTLFCHPTNPAGKERMTRFYTESMLGFPLDTTLAATELVFSGYLEVYDDLEIILSHLGGALPFLRARLPFLYSETDPAFTGDDVLAELTRSPGEYLDAFWYDTAMTFPRAMAFCHDLVGSRLVFGSDYPFGRKTSVPDTADQVAAIPVEEDVRVDIREANARALLHNT